MSISTITSRAVRAANDNLYDTRHEVEVLALWDPCEVLDINIHRKLCIGIPKSAPYRLCLVGISMHSLASATRKLKRLSQMDPSSTAATSMLPEIAEKLLCVNWHQYQSYDIVSEWKSAIRDFVRQRNDDEEAEVIEQELRERNRLPNTPSNFIGSSSRITSPSIEHGILTPPPSYDRATVPISVSSGNTPSSSSHIDAVPSPPPTINRTARHAQAQTSRAPAPISSANIDSITTVQLNTQPRPTRVTSVTFADLPSPPSEDPFTSPPADIEFPSTPSFTLFGVPPTEFVQRLREAAQTASPAAEEPLLASTGSNEETPVADINWATATPAASAPQDRHWLSTRPDTQVSTVAQSAPEPEPSSLANTEAVEPSISTVEDPPAILITAPAATPNLSEPLHVTQPEVQNDQPLSNESEASNANSTTTILDHSQAPGLSTSATATTPQNPITSESALLIPHEVDTSLSPTEITPLPHPEIHRRNTLPALPISNANANTNTRDFNTRPLPPLPLPPSLSLQSNPPTTANTTATTTIMRMNEKGYAEIGTQTYFSTDMGTQTLSSSSPYSPSREEVGEVSRGELRTALGVVWDVCIGKCIGLHRRTLKRSERIARERQVEDEQVEESVRFC